MAKYAYDPFGQVLSVTNASGTAISTTAANVANYNPFRYRGYYYDTESGFYYLQSRYYDPEICRFINADNYASTGQGFLGCNMFAYCNNSPILYIDKDGDMAAEATIVATNFWNPAGWIAAGLLVIEVVVLVCEVDKYVKQQTQVQSPVLFIFEQLEEEVKENRRPKVVPHKGGDQYDIHHIVAKAAGIAEPAREVLRSFNLEPRTYPLNLMPVPRWIHRSIHTSAYYLYVNRVILACKTKSDVITALIRLRGEIIFYIETGYAPWYQ